MGASYPPFCVPFSACLALEISANWLVYHTYILAAPQDSDSGEVLSQKGRKDIPLNSTRYYPCRTGLPSLGDLMPDDLRWSWCNNNSRNKAHNKYKALESSQNHPPTLIHGNIVFKESGPWCRKGSGQLLWETAVSGPFASHISQVGWGKRGSRERAWKLPVSGLPSLPSCPTGFCGFAHLYVPWHMLFSTWNALPFFLLPRNACSSFSTQLKWKPGWTPRQPLSLSLSLSLSVAPALFKGLGYSAHTVF